VAGALWTAGIARLYERLGPRAIVTAGSAALAAGVASLGVVARPWQLYPAFLLMSAGWGAMSGAAINIILAPWFERRRGLAISIAFNGATLGGVLVASPLISLIGAVGLPRALAMAALAMLAVMVGVALGILRRGPDDIGLGPDGDSRGAAPARPTAGVGHRWPGDAVRTWRFWSVSAPFALGLMAQVGVLTHLVALVSAALGAGGAARAVAGTTAAALVGRLATGIVADRMNRRLIASATLLVQMAGLGALTWAASPAGIYAGCALFGLGVGNLTTLPGLILAAEWPRERFSALVGLAVGINQFAFAFGPSIVGLVRDWSGTRGPALAICAALELIAAVVVALGPGRQTSTR